jgi:hypothetical protein
VSGPHNRKAFATGQRHRAEIRRVWLEQVTRFPFEHHSAKTIRRLLSFKASERSVAWHMQQIRNDQCVADAAMYQPAPKPDDIADRDVVSETPCPAPSE